MVEYAKVILKRHGQHLRYVWLADVADRREAFVSILTKATSLRFLALTLGPSKSIDALLVRRGVCDLRLTPQAALKKRAGSIEALELKYDAWLDFSGSYAYGRIDGKQMDQLGKVLQALPKLQELSLQQGCDGTDAELLAAIWRLADLHTLTFSSCNSLRAPIPTTPPPPILSLDSLGDGYGAQPIHDALVQALAATLESLAGSFAPAGPLFQCVAREHAVLITVSRD